MENYSKIHKIILTFFVLGFVVWFGGTIARTSIAFDLFTSGTHIELKPEYSNIERMNTIYLFAITAPTVGIAYFIATVSALALMVLMRKKIKKKGWLFMIFCLFAITVPIQFRFLYYDYILASAIYFENITDFYNPIIQEYFVEQFKNVVNNSLRGISLLSALTCIIYLIWKPLEDK